MPSKTGVNSKCMLMADVSLTCATAEIKEVREYLFTRLPMCYPHCFVFSSHKNAFSVCKIPTGHMLFRENSLLKGFNSKKTKFYLLVSLSRNASSCTP